MAAAEPTRPDARRGRPDDHEPDHHEARDHEPGDHEAVLRDQLARATEHVAALQTEFDELLADPEVIQEDRDAVALLLEHARNQLDSVRDAVARVEAGTYGRCVNCGGEIGAERLAALAGVTTCVRCAG